MRVIKFTGAEFSLLFLAGKEVVGACGGVVCGCEQLAIGSVIKLGKDIALGIGNSPYTAKVVGDVVIGLPTAVFLDYSSAGNGKALGNHSVAINNSQSQRACIEDFFSTVTHYAVLGAVTQVAVVDGDACSGCDILGQVIKIDANEQEI